MTRPAVHAASGHRLGASDPRQEGPADLRLVPPALAAWAAAALAVGAPGWWTGLAVTVCVVVAGLLLAPVSLRAMRARTGGGGPAADGGDSGAGRRGLRLNATALAAMLLCGAAGAASAGLHGADLRRGPLPELADQYAHVMAELTVTSDPRLTRPRVRGDQLAGRSVVLDAEVSRVTGPGGTVTVTRTPVLVIVRAGASGEAGDSAARWLRLLPSTPLRLAGRLAPPLNTDDRFAAVLRPDGSGPPPITGPPTALQRTAGGLRAGLRAATDGLAPDARALLPGLVVGDTSRVPPDLQDAFEATDLTHLLAVSGDNIQ